MKVEPHKSSTGLDANLWAMLVYIITIILGWIPYVQYVAWLFPLVIFFTEKDSEFGKFHAMQVMALYVINAIIQIILGIIGFALSISLMVSAVNPLNWGGAIGGAIAYGAISIVGGIVVLVLMIFAIIALIRAYQYEEYRMPLAGVLADKFRAMANK